MSRSTCGPRVHLMRTKNSFNFFPKHINNEHLLNYCSKMTRILVCVLHFDIVLLPYTTPILRVDVLTINECFSSGLLLLMLIVFFSIFLLFFCSFFFLCCLFV